MTHIWIARFAIGGVALIIITIAAVSCLINKYKDHKGL